MRAADGDECAEKIVCGRGGEKGGGRRGGEREKREMMGERREREGKDRGKGERREREREKCKRRQEHAQEDRLSYKKRDAEAMIQTPPSV
jgi:hypothetical protein